MSVRLVSKHGMFSRASLSVAMRSVSVGVPNIPTPYNEHLNTFLEGSIERNAIQAEIKAMRAEEHEIPLIINGEKIYTGDTAPIVCPFDKNSPLGVYHKARPSDVKMAIEANVEAQKEWANLSVEERLSIFMRLSHKLGGKHYQRLNAATVLGQGKNWLQAEIDAKAEFVDFLRFNAKYAEDFGKEQPASPPGIWNRMTYRPLEGFVYAITPFNFSAIAGNLVCAPAMMGNVVLWKPSDSAILSGYVLMDEYLQAGMPAGVVSFVPGDPAMITDIALKHSALAGVHYTGSSAVFREIFKNTAANMERYKTYPRIVGETGGKDFIFAHSSARVEALSAAIIRAGFEYAGQKCSACSRAYVPRSLWPELKTHLAKHHALLKVGPSTDPSVLVNAVIHQRSFDKCASYLKMAAESKECEVLLGGGCSDSTGFFVEPTIVECSNPRHPLMVEEIFGPIVSIHVYEDEAFVETLRECDQATEYSLTGSIFAQDIQATATAMKELEFSAGNFYINDKCTGSVVGQQPFGGARSSGTNDKAGSSENLRRWVSPRSIKENLYPTAEILYPYME